MISHVLSCPSCQSALKLPKLPTQGKRVRCPKCKSVFAAPATAQPSVDSVVPSYHETTSRVKELANEPTLGQPGTKPEPSTAGDPSGLDLAFLAPAEKPDELGRLGGYRILKVLGHGGMGAVLLAEDPKLKRQVAVKVMLPQLAKSKQARERFLREAQAAAALEHDYIVPILHVGEDRDVPYIVMPFLRGESLDTRLKQPEPLAMSAILGIATQATEALVVAHNAGFIHRDIKPANIWLEQRRKDEGGMMKDEKEKTAGSPSSSYFILPPSSFRLKLLDFGLARLAVQEEQHLTQSGAMLGTPGFIAPEQAEGREVDGRADVFSLGCVLYRLTTGTQAFPGATMIARLQSLIAIDPTAPCDVNPETPAELSDLIGRMLAKDRDHRPTAAEVLDQLQSLPCVLSSPTVLRGKGAGGEGKRNPTPNETRFRETPRPHFPQSSPPGIVPKGKGAVTKLQRRLAWLVLALLLFAPLAWYAANVVLRLETENGTVLVQINDDAVEARIKNGKLILTGPDGKDRYTLAPDERNKLIAAGPYKIRVDGADGLSLDTEEFTLKKGDTVTVRVTLEAKKPTDGPTYTNSIGMEFVRVPKGKFFMGGGGGKVGDKEVEIPDDYYLGKYEVTQDEWEKVTGNNPSSFKAGNKAVEGIALQDIKQFPVEQISWDDCQEFLKQLNEREPSKTWRYRLPTEAEWEYACREGPGRGKSHYGFDFYFDRPTNTPAADRANFESENCPKRTCKVGSYPPNRLGFYDMHGNVWEWCDDPTKTPEGRIDRSHRGGSWDHMPMDCRAWDNRISVPTNGGPHIGVRVARVPIAETNPLTYTNAIGMEFVRVPKGKFFMGGGGGKVGDKEVEIPDDFYLGKYEVTQEEWQKVTGLNPSQFNAVAGVATADQKRFPVEMVSWDDCQAFVRLVNEKVKEPGWVCRLPTEAEWEYACRGGSTTNTSDYGFDFYFEKPSLQLRPEQANFNQILRRPCKVGSYQPNKLGLYDMHGNIWEWCNDTAKVVDGIAWRVIRGGSGSNDSRLCLASFRNSNPQSSPDNFLGLRLARVPAARTHEK